MPRQASSKSSLKATKGQSPSFGPKRRGGRATSLRRGAEVEGGPTTGDGCTHEGQRETTGGGPPPPGVNRGAGGKPPTAVAEAKGGDRRGGKALEGSPRCGPEARSGAQGARAEGRTQPRRELGADPRHPPGRHRAGACKEERAPGPAGPAPGEVPGTAVPTPRRRACSGPGPRPHARGVPGRGDRGARPGRTGVKTHHYRRLC